MADYSSLPMRFVFIALALLTIFSLACGENDTEPPERVNALDIWDAYLINETRANVDYKGRDLLVQLDRIDEIESDGKILRYMGMFQWEHIELDFKNDEDVLDLNPGRSIEAVCRLRGFQLDLWLQFNNCRLPDSDT